ncbi:MAG: TIGR03862 family flavoprotein [Azonexus sp.]
MSRQIEIRQPEIIIVGGGPAGLMAADRLSACPDLRVTVYDAMPSLGRKFLMAGVGGMNITHSEPGALFLSRYGPRAPEVAPWLADFGPQAIREWMHGLGIESFVGSSGKVFPRDMKAAPLLRAWLQRLRQRGVRFKVRQRWLGWQGAQADGRLRFQTPAGEAAVRADAVLFALGGGSWPQLGSDAAWVPVFSAAGVAVQPLKPANCGFTVAWSAYLRARFAGAAVKAVSACCCVEAGGEADSEASGEGRQGEFNITGYGVEGSLIYALAAPLRDALLAGQPAVLYLDLLPGRSLADLQAALAQPRGRDSLANHLRRRAGLSGVKAALLHELLAPESLRDMVELARRIKCLPLPLIAARPLGEAISTAGGVAFEAVNADLMLRRHPGVFVAGEMLDWEAPTGGYLLTACLASGYRAGEGIRRWLG